jgi:hypothetical protein
MGDDIVSSGLICITPAGERIPVTIVIGRPYCDGDGLWVCPVGLEGLYRRLSPMKSDDPFHALCLSVFLVRNLLAGFIEEGGRVLIASTNEDFPIEAYFPSSSAG